MEGLEVTPTSVYAPHGLGSSVALAELNGMEKDTYLRQGWQGW